ncbi:MAG TPA: UPF0182 family protein [Solibacterales bacterium]|nr:UPF0182 family protein [Bryobacterales bacterium]
MPGERVLPAYGPAHGSRHKGIILIAILAFLLFAVRWLSSLAIEYAWWKELGQVETWFNLFLYQYSPLAAATLLAFAALWLTHRLGMRFGGAHQAEARLYRLAVSLVLLFVAWLISAATLENWTVVRYIGSRGLPAVASSWHDNVFGKNLGFYLFDLPFYSALLGYVLALAVVAGVLFWITARGWQLRYRMAEVRDMRELDLGLLRLPGGLESGIFRTILTLFLLALAVHFFLGRFDMVYNDHGFMVGVDYTDEHVVLPLQWLLVAAAVLAAACAWLRRWTPMLLLALALPVAWIVPRLVSALYVKPNEISLESPYIDAHIHATRSAYGLENRLREIEYKTQPGTSIDVNRHRNLLDNVRLWDWRPFHDTVTQSQALRPYYVFHDTDVDRYTIDGQLRQTLITPRELDISRLQGANASWVNPHFIYTHGYGVALAEVSKLTPEGLPVFLIQNMPPEISTPSLKITRPEIYYGEVLHEPVFVRTAQEEFNYPSGDANQKSRYDGSGGFPISSVGMRLLAAIHYADANILLTNYLTPQSRMMIRRQVLPRLQELAGFIEWDQDPYLVITPAGRLVWIADGYTTSDAHPFARLTDVGTPINYIRNSVKATIDAYDGSTRLYDMDPADPLIGAYRRLFPQLFHDVSEMPPEIRAHLRYPETLFRVQAALYRVFHMTNPQAFYNKEDIWELSRSTSGQNSTAQSATPTYVVATLPGEDKPEFMLMTTFTPFSKENLIGVMLARCDGEHLGERVVLALSKQELTLGPMQISARINQDQNISKDLTLWNQQGSQVLRGQPLVLPVEHTFLFVEPIYLQANEARMPQLKKIVLAIGNRLIYADTYDEALVQLGQGATSTAPTAISSAAPAPVTFTGTAAEDNARLARVKTHLQKYRELTAQGHYVDAAKELESIEKELNR